MLCTCTFFAFVVPFHRTQNGLTRTGELVLSLTGIFFLVNTLYNYYMCVVTDAGTPPLVAEQAESGEATISTTANSALSNRLNGYNLARGSIDSSDDSDAGERNDNECKSCSKCYRIRSARTHHCSICKNCIVKMDHHCPWIYNCVGYGNYKYFYLFLLHLTIVDAFYVLSSLDPLSYSLNVKEGEASALPLSTRSWVILTVVLAFAMGVAVLGFLAFHTYLILNNLTTIEFLQGRSRADHKLRSRGKFSRNRFDLGRSRNWGEVFGHEHGSFWNFKWALSPFHKRSYDGNIPITIFPTINQHRHTRPSE